MTAADERAAPVIHPAKLPQRQPPESLHVRPDPDGVVATDPVRAGWRYLSFRAFALDADEIVLLDRPEQEAAIVTISGGGVEVALDDGARLQLTGRPTVFEGMPWTAYVPAGTTARIVGRPLPGRRAVVAVAQAPLSGRPIGKLRPEIVRPEDVEIEIRGAGNATRQVNNIMMPDFAADRLLICEVFTPSGNWSGWPPHKHDIDDPPREAVLEETYFYQLSRPEGWAIQRVYHRDGSGDRMIVVRHGDLVIVDQGYHPFAATQGYDAYYLNALAGDRRTMANTDDPDLAWVRSLWPAMAPRSAASAGPPVTPASGAAGGRSTATAAPGSVAAAAVGRHRRLFRLGGQRGVIAGIAIDHRDSLRVMLDQRGSTGLGTAELRSLKLALTRALAPAATAVMLDEELGGLALEAGAVPATVALIMPLEAQGYETTGDGPATTLLDDFSPAAALRYGADACKLLLPYRIDDAGAAAGQEALVSSTAVACRRARPATRHRTCRLPPDR